MNQKWLLPTIVIVVLAIAIGAYFLGRTTAGTPSSSNHAVTSSTTTSIATPPTTSTTDNPDTTPTTAAPTKTPTGPTVPASVIAACSRIGGTPVEGQDNWYILGPTYLNPECKNVPYLGPDGETYYDDFPLTDSGISSTDIYGNSAATAFGGTAATESECNSGNYPEANPGVDTPGNWDPNIGLCLP
jgi:hypothetical protein